MSWTVFEESEMIWSVLVPEAEIRAMVWVIVALLEVVASSVNVLLLSVMIGSLAIGPAVGRDRKSVKGAGSSGPKAMGKSLRGTGWSSAREEKEGLANMIASVSNQGVRREVCGFMGVSPARLHSLVRVASGRR